MALAYFFLRAALREEEESSYRRSLRRRILRERFTVNSIPDKEFIYKFRLSRELFNQLCEELTPLLPPKRRSHGLEPSMKILSVLNFFAWGRLQRSMERNFSMPLAKQTLSRCIREVTQALNHRSITQKYMKFPQNKADRDTIKKKFYEKFGFPDVVGCIDCTHIAIIKSHFTKFCQKSKICEMALKPVTNELNYLNPQNYYSFFPQIICDADYNILSVDASYGGKAHNSDVWLAHRIDDHLKALQETTYLIGDTNYTLEDNMMTPIVDDVIENSPESRYNDIHKATHATISQTIYKLKARWRCLLTTKELHYNHEMAARIFIACCILHNMCNMAGMEAPELSERDIEEERKRQNEPMYDCCDMAEEERARLVQLFEAKRIGDLSKLCDNTTEGTER